MRCCCCCCCHQPIKTQEGQQRCHNLPPVWHQHVACVHILTSSPPGAAAQAQSPAEAAARLAALPHTRTRCKGGCERGVGVGANKESEQPCTSPDPPTHRLAVGTKLPTLEALCCPAHLFTLAHLHLGQDARFGGVGCAPDAMLAAGMLRVQDCFAARGLEKADDVVMVAPALHKWRG